MLVFSTETYCMKKTSVVSCPRSVFVSLLMTHNRNPQSVCEPTELSQRDKSKMKLLLISSEEVAGYSCFASDLTSASVGDIRNVRVSRQTDICTLTYLYVDIQAGRRTGGRSGRTVGPPAPAGSHALSKARSRRNARKRSRASELCN